MIPSEKCLGYTVTMSPPDFQPPMVGTYTRGGATKTKLFPGSASWPKGQRSIVLSCLAIDKRDGASVDPRLGGSFIEPNDRWVGATIDPTVTPIIVFGQRINADNMAMVQVATKFVPTDVTPGVNNTWYMWNMGASTPHTVRMTWSRHPNCNCGANDVQAAFDAGARIMATDDDTLIRDGDPRLNDPAVYVHDDTPTYLEFLVIKAGHATFPSTPVNFTLPVYNTVTQWGNLQVLAAAQFANVKLVDNITIDGTNYAGCGVPGQPSIVLERIGLAGPEAVHEYGHNAGLPDRPNDVRAVMYPAAAINVEVNRDERTAYYSWNPPLWNQ
jgi:hypothetical protein